ncbi:hypothetical protein DPMN_186683 [Dreissena polymorpha]|uniref:TIR domain-containing protein n=1 Tax=Dreissena polymorpha TaxID=45954 RepID=A0A9D4DNA5_DREPO|nr:hypothetical protein DPMN_186683 [Dreissena polymorpha]
MDTIDQLAAATNSHKLRIDLSNMPYICSCDDDHMETIQWIHKNRDTFIARFRQKQRERKNIRSQIELGEFPKKFVACLSLSSKDAELVVDTILPRLNSELQRKTKTETNSILVSSGDRHFRHGYALGEEIIRCIEDSAVIILAVSKHFCQKEWCRKEVQGTYDQNKAIVLLFLEKVEPDEMGKVLRKLFSSACSSACSTYCVCIKDRATCRTPDPSGLVLSEHIREVVLHDVNAWLLTNTTFSSNPQWSQIKSLEIWVVKGQHLGSRIFTGLSDLNYLGYHNEYMRDMGNDAFYGLENVKELDFSRNIGVWIEDFSSSLKSDHLPRLKTLTLTGINSCQYSCVAKDDVFRSIVGHDIKRNITYLDISNVSFWEFDVEAFVQSGLCDSVHELYLRHATLKMNPDAMIFKSCRSLKILDLSYSKLPNFRLSGTHRHTFWWLLRSYFINTQELYMNGVFKYMLTPTLPEYLKDFNIGRLTNLKVLNLSYNALSYIDAQARDTMEQLAAATNSHKLQIHLSNMPFICSCDDDHMKTIQWIHKNRDTFITSPREDYMCTFQGERLYIFQNALEKTNDYCRLQNLKRNLAISVPIVCVFVLIGLVIFFKIQGFRQRQRERKNIRSQIELGEFPKKFVAFLSFSSEDAELVVDTILPRLNAELQRQTKTGTSRVLVCSGDRHFRPGHALGEEIIRCIEDSAVIILAVSKHFCQKEWCRKEMQETYDQNKPIVLLFLEKVEPDEMGKVLRMLFSSCEMFTVFPKKQAFTCEIKVGGERVFRVAGTS